MQSSHLNQDSETIKTPLVSRSHTSSYHSLPASEWISRGIVCTIFVGIVGLFICGAIMAAVILIADPFTPIGYNFFVIGDWGTGTAEQLAVASAMNTLASSQNFDFVVSTGDHFYWQGIENATDPLIKRFYEDIYGTLANLKSLRWFLCLGNHDWIKNPLAQIEYGARINRNWNLPNKRHTKEFFMSGAAVQFIFMDTSPYSELERSRVPKLRNEDWQEQTRWLRTVLETGRVSGRYRWRYVIGHHTFYSSGTYGDFGHRNMTEVEGLFNEYKIDGYFGGHQHILQHLQTDVRDHRMNYFISGAGGQTVSNHIVNPNHPHNKFVVGKEAGFMTQQLNRTHSVTSIFNSKPEKLYEYVQFKN